METLKNDVLSAEIVELYVTKDSVGYDLVNNVDEEKLNDLLNDLSEIKFTYKYRNPQLSEGPGLKLNKSDGYILLCRTRIHKFDINGIWVFGDYIYQPEGFDDFILKYRIKP